ncbi:AbaSI family restriction endonuclease [Bifidobacterium sp. ESL0764]|uniref:AbaSI family restriction endonuclease n=1 Tax=Bifidobacterium sp. ESL0764 TaxID=2983228 RepID=UPI0023F94097|nr:restriction endonuclease [Bifidobacterium sp. ESL0764]WEV65243.1 restriction endonuclease [Bifidobacterium sp. ESL0764]
MDKLDYLIRTLSRTKRKDYENYVVNAVWNRLDMDDVKPVTQQVVLWNDDHRSFIDLFFPQIMIGVECDESYHELQRGHDIDRELTIVDVLRQIGEGEYRAIHIDVSKSYEDVENEIDDCVKTIRREVENSKKQNDFKPWVGAQTYKRFYEDRDAITVSDDIGFPTIADAVNLICGSDYKAFQSTWFIPKALRPLYGDRYRVWFPKLAVNHKAVSKGWNNQLIDKSHIEEYNENTNVIDDVKPNDMRITFAKSIDPITRVNEYRFVGVFRRVENSADGLRKQYERIADTFPIHRGKAS